MSLDYSGKPRPVRSPEEFRELQGLQEFLNNPMWEGTPMADSAKQKLISQRQEILDLQISCRHLQRRIKTLQDQCAVFKTALAVVSVLLLLALVAMTEGLV